MRNAALGMQGMMNMQNSNGAQTMSMGAMSMGGGMMDGSGSGSAGVNGMTMSGGMMNNPMMMNQGSPLVMQNSMANAQQQQVQQQQQQQMMLMGATQGNAQQSPLGRVLTIDSAQLMSEITRIDEELKKGTLDNISRVKMQLVKANCQFQLLRKDFAMKQASGQLTPELSQTLTHSGNLLMKNISSWKQTLHNLMQQGNTNDSVGGGAGNI